MKITSLAGIAFPVLFFGAILGISPAFAQVDLSGYWATRPHEDNMARGPGLEIGEYEGYPVNAAGRMKARSWNAAVYSNPERQCIPLGMVASASGFRMWKEVDQLSQAEIAWHLRLDFQAQERTIWMDGRPHPSEYAAHTFQGFSTGKWDHNQLVVTTTHLKVSVIERNGIPRSDAATTIEHFIRRGDILTIVHIVTDPVWLEEPFIQTRDYALDIYAKPNGSTCVPVNEVANRPKGYVPHYLPGKNPLLLEAATKFNVPVEALGGGAETAYPEFKHKLKNQPGAAGSSSENRLQTKPPVSVTPALAPQLDLDKVTILTLPVQGSVYMLVGAGANTTVHVGEHFVAVVDTQYAPLGNKIIVAIRQLTAKPIRYVINTNFRPDHIGGNEAIAKAGTSLGNIGNNGPDMAAEKAPAEIVAHENVLKRVSAPTGRKSTVPVGAWPTETYVGEDYRLFSGEAIKIVHEAAANTDGDSIVIFPRSDVISVGDIFSTTRYPVIDRQNGGSIRGEIAALNQIIDLSTPKDRQEGGTYVIPSKGRICDQADVVEYRDMVTIIRDRIEDLAKRGMTLEQVKTEQPTFDYDGIYGAPTDSWTKDMFIEAVYRDVMEGKGR